AEAREKHAKLLAELGVGEDETREARPPTEFEIKGAQVDASDHRGVAGNVREFDGDLGLVIGAGGGSLTLFDAIRKHGGRPANYCEIGGNPSVKKACELTKLILSKPGVRKIAVMMNVVSNTRVDIVARGVIKGCVEAGRTPAETIATDRIPRGEVAQMVELARLRGARIIGPNCLGILSPEEAKMGGLGGPAVNVRRAFKKGPIGVMSRSGGMTTEIANTLSAAGLGQSTAVSIGGDAIIGSTYAELMPLFEADPETRAIVIYSEPGGRMAAELAAWVRENKSRLPIVAFMAGRFMDEMPGMRFGHAGTIVEGKADTTVDKIERMKAAGIAVAERIEDIPALVKERLRGH